MREREDVLALPLRGGWLLVPDRLAHLFPTAWLVPHRGCWGIELSERQADRLSALDLLESLVR